MNSLAMISGYKRGNDSQDASALPAVCKIHNTLLAQKHVMYDSPVTRMPLIGKTGHH